LELKVKNVGSATAGVDAAFLRQIYTGSDPKPVTWGIALSPGDEHLVSDDNFNSAVSVVAVGGGALAKADGQLVMRTPTRVTTVTFHGGVGGDPNGFCQLSGTAAFADS
jgi:hypothetical protein